MPYGRCMHSNVDHDRCILLICARARHSEGEHGRLDYIRTRSSSPTPGGMLLKSCGPVLVKSDRGELDSARPAGLRATIPPRRPRGGGLVGQPFRRPPGLPLLNCRIATESVRRLRSLDTQPGLGGRVHRIAGANELGRLNRDARRPSPMPSTEYALFHLKIFVRAGKCMPR